MIGGNADPPRSCRGRSIHQRSGRVTTIPYMGDRLSRDRLADRSGVDPEYLDRLVSLGILTMAIDGTFAGSARQVVRLVRSFDGSGITPEHIGEAVRAGQLSLAFLDQPGYERSRASAT